MSISLYKHQKDAVEKLRSGSILRGGVGSGKSRTALVYYYTKECGGYIPNRESGKIGIMKNPKDLYIITTARKRDKLEWEEELIPFLLSTNNKLNLGVKVVVDSWNNIKKYRNVKGAFFIFDEQKVGGSGVWVNMFLRICKLNNWILLSAVPGDSWKDYIPVFVANGFYKNRTEFNKQHVVFARFTKWPKIERYIGIARLVRLREQITVNMYFKKKTVMHNKTVITDYNKEIFKRVMKDRWNVYDGKPIKDISKLCYLMRRVVNTDQSRLKAVEDLSKKHSRLIIFYNFDYELELLLTLGERLDIPTRQWNGHKHEEIPETESWFYLVQYFAGAEAWNCIETNAMIFYSQNYSYKTTIQAAGRIDRLNTPFVDLYYYYFRSTAPIDLAIQKALRNKKTFNENSFFKN